MRRYTDYKYEMLQSFEREKKAMKLLLDTAKAIASHA